jgi:NAD(P)-dependent dehydrogenase (short-subunit alcohol dehydrogenase family)
MFSPFSLIGKTILITGASSGIGKATAVECAKLGARLIITGRNEEKLHEVYNTLEGQEGQEHTLIIADLSDYTQIVYLVNELPKLDGIVCNAGIVKAMVIQASEKDDVIETFNINTFAPIHLIQLLLQNKKMNKKASILFISSISGVYCGTIGGAFYGSSKAALQGFSKALALEVAPKGIRVNTINPGMIDTGIFQNTSISQEQLTEDANKYPLKRYGTPEEVAYAAIYFLSDATQWITGTSLLIDGGYTLI